MKRKSMISRRFFIKSVGLFSGGLVLACELGVSDNDIKAVSD